MKKKSDNNLSESENRDIYTHILKNLPELENRDIYSNAFFKKDFGDYLVGIFSLYLLFSLTKVVINAIF